MASVSEVISVIETLAPRRLAESWDNVGLMVGDPSREVGGVTVALDLSREVLEEAESLGVNLIVTHHPPIFEPLRSLRADRYPESLLLLAAARGVAVYSAHTNLDNAERGVGWALGGALGVQELRPFGSGCPEVYYKLVVFVPKGYEDRVRDAVSAAGAGWIGNYSHCTFQTPGTGTFKPLEGADPFLGSVGQLEYADEYRLETILPEEKKGDVIRAMLKAHPYEEVAYDLYRLAGPSREHSPGRIGFLPEPVELRNFVDVVRQALKPVSIRVVNPDKEVRSVAVMPGSAGKRWAEALAAGADLLVTGEIGYHHALEARDAGLGVIETGHYASERPIVAFLVEWLGEEFPGTMVVESRRSGDAFSMGRV